MPAVLCLLSCPTVLFCAVQPVHLCVFVSKIRSENKFAILSILACIFCFFARLRGWAAEEEDEDEDLLGGVLRMEGVDVVRWLG